MSWNLNVHYHDIVIGAIPLGCQHALDVGCGRGALARKLAQRCYEVVAIDVDQECLDFAKAVPQMNPNIIFLQGDLFESLPEESFDFVAAVATLHHLPLRSALRRFRGLLRPGGVLAVVGLYRLATPVDYTIASVALPVSRIVRALIGEDDVGAPLQDPKEPLVEIRAACEALLPGGIFRCRLFFRYSFVWRKP